MSMELRTAAVDRLFSAVDHFFSRLPDDERAISATLVAAESSRRLVRTFADVFLNPARRPIQKQAAHRVRSSIPNGLRTPQEVATRLGMSVKQVKTLALKDGELRFINTGRGTKNIRMMFTDADVEEFIKRRHKRNTPQQQSPTQKGTSHRAAEVIGFTARRLMNKKQKAD
jgi:AraC-like DNA-binding protein